MKPITPSIARLIESGKVEFQFSPRTHGRKKNSGKSKWFQGRSALNEAAGVEFSDQLYRCLIQECQTLIEHLPIENNPREDWQNFHKRCLDLISAAEKLHIKYELIERLTIEAEDADQIARSIQPEQFEKSAKRGSPLKLTPAIETYIRNVVSIYHQAGGETYGSYPTTSPSGKTIHLGGVQELICVIFDALRDSGCPFVFDGDTCFDEDINRANDIGGDDEILIDYDENPQYTISRASIHGVVKKANKGLR